MEEYMKNLEQIRATNAIKAARETTKQDVNKLPALILNNGLLATLAFTLDKNDKGGYVREKMTSVMNESAKHLSNSIFGFNFSSQNAEDLLKNLSNSSSYDLQRATAEILEFISYVKRFAVKESKD